MIEKLIKEFWSCSVINNFSTFNFTLFFNEFKQQLHEKLSLHGVLELKDYIQHVSKYYDLSILKQFVYESKHTNATFSFETILSAIFKPRFEHFRELHKSNQAYKKLKELYKKLCGDLSKLDMTRHVLLVDECIHAQHNSGFILNIDIKQLRESYEEKIKRLSLDKAFGIFTRNALEEQIIIIKKPFTAIFLDLNDIHSLNKTYGYTNVNDMILKSIQSFTFRKTDIVGRWFSGDELLIATNETNVEPLLDRFHSHVKKHGVSFKYRIFKDVQSFEDLEKNINKVKW